MVFDATEILSFKLFIASVYRINILKTGNGVNIALDSAVLKSLGMRTIFPLLAFIRALRVRLTE